MIDTNVHQFTGFVFFFLAAAVIVVACHGRTVCRCCGI
jgi:hypothetical protein